MSMRTTILTALQAWADRYDGDIAPGVPEQMVDAYRAEIRRETQLEDADQIEAWQHDADDAAAFHHGALTDTETAAHIAVHRAAKGLRSIAAGTQGAVPIESETTT